MLFFLSGERCVLRSVLLLVEVILYPRPPFVFLAGVGLPPVSSEILVIHVHTQLQYSYLYITWACRGVHALTLLMAYGRGSLTASGKTQRNNFDKLVTFSDVYFSLAEIIDNLALSTLYYSEITPDNLASIIRIIMNNCRDNSR